MNKQSCLAPASCWFLAWPTFRWRWYILYSSETSVDLVFTGLRGVILQKTELYTVHGNYLVIRSRLQIQRSGFVSLRYHIFWEVVGLEGGPLSLVSAIEELLERKSSGSGLESREYGRRDPLRWPRGTFYPQKLALNLPTRGGRSRTQAKEFSFSITA
jgi:hypothetical protein